MTHTMRRNHDKTWTWAVGTLEVESNGIDGMSTTFTIMFDKMSFSGALGAVQVLNGGGDLSKWDSSMLYAMERCAV